MSTIHLIPALDYLFSWCRNEVIDICKKQLQHFRAVSVLKYLGLLLDKTQKFSFNLTA